GLFQRLALFCNLSDYFHQSAILNQKIVEKSAVAAWLRAESRAKIMRFMLLSLTGTAWNFA
ncbi:MAG: hypothetical protein ACTINL_20905, partial [Serratia proteamaculans]